MNDGLIPYALHYFIKFFRLPSHLFEKFRFLCSNKYSISSWAVTTHTEVHNFLAHTLSSVSIIYNKNNVIPITFYTV